MYDYINGTIQNDANSFFDVFFEVNRPGDQEDYLVRIKGGSLHAFEKDKGVMSPLAADGSFDITSNVWRPFQDNDPMHPANFKGALGFGQSPNSPTEHAMAEFELTFEPPPGSVFGSPGTHPGLYDPAPAFWSASNKGNLLNDPPISSAIFTLNPDGTTTVVPALGPGGAPVQQPQQVVPEPSTLGLFGAGLVALLVGAWRRKRHSERC
jgi:hypothetical protein